MLKLVGSSPTEDVAPVILNKPMFLIGRHTEADYKLTDLSISRHHCCIFKRNDTYSVKDTSASGLNINGLKLNKDVEYVLIENDIIELSESLKYRFHLSHSKELGDRCTKVLNESSSRPVIVTKENVPLENLMSDARVKKAFAEEQENYSTLEASHKTKITNLQSEMKTLRGALKKAQEDIISGQDALHLEKEAAISEKDRNCKEEGALRIEMQRAKSDAVTSKRELEREKEKNMVKLDALRGEMSTLRDEKDRLESHVRELEAGLSRALASQLEKLEQVTETEVQCAICFELVVGATTLSCCHTFCEQCIADWRVKSNLCPTCRAKIRRATRCKMLDLYVSKVSDILSASFREKRREVLSERNMDSQCQLKRPCLGAGVRPHHNVPPEPEVFIDLTTSM